MKIDRSDSRTSLENIKICSRCVYDEMVPGISFDQTGACNYCKLHDDLEGQYPTGVEGEARLQAMVAEIKKSGRGREYDCIIGVSGGCDSSYLLHRMVEVGLRPLAVHFDNTWNSPIATQNIYNVINKLGIDLFTYVVDNREYDDIYRAFMLAGVRDIEAPTDIAFASVLYMAAEKHGIKYIIEGYSFRTEGVSPLGSLYMDGKYIASVHKAYGKQPMKTYPNMTLSRFLRWTVVRGIRRVRPLYNMEYDKECTKKFLAETYGWQWYGGHDLENRFTAYYHSYFMPVRFSSDQRWLGYAALVRSGQLERDAALNALREPPFLDDDILALVKKRLGFSEEEFERVMTQPVKTWREFPTYKRYFVKMRALFYLLTKTRRVPESFYVKFCFPSNLGNVTSRK